MLSMPCRGCNIGLRPVLIFFLSLALVFPVAYAGQTGEKEKNKAESQTAQVPKPDKPKAKEVYEPVDYTSKLDSQDNFDNSEFFKDDIFVKEKKSVSRKRAAVKKRAYKKSPLEGLVEPSKDPLLFPNNTPKKKAKKSKNPSPNLTLQP